MTQPPIPEGETFEKEPQPMKYQPLFNLMAEHGLLLLEDEMYEIVNCVKSLTDEHPQKVEKKEIIQILTEIEQSSTSGDPLRDIALLKAMATDLKNKLKNSQSESQAGGEWIDIEKKLPGCLATDLFTGGTKVWVLGEDKIWISQVMDAMMWKYYMQEVGVTHWMPFDAIPLPEPPMPQ